LWDKKRLALIVIASTFMVRGNPYPVLFHSRTAKGTDRRGRRYASLAMTPLLPTSDHPTKIREEPFKLGCGACSVRNALHRNANHGAKREITAKPIHDAQRSFIQAVSLTNSAFADYLINSSNIMLSGLMEFARKSVMREKSFPSC